MSSSAWAQRNISSINKRINGENSIFWCFVGNSLLFFVSIVRLHNLSPKKKRFFLWYFFAPIGEFLCVSWQRSQQKEVHTGKLCEMKSHSCDRQQHNIFLLIYGLFSRVELNFAGISSSRIVPPHDDRVELKMLHVINDLRRPQKLENIFFDIFMLDNESTAIKCIEAVHPAINFPITFSFLCRPRHVELTSSFLSFQKVTRMRLESIYHSRRAGGSRKLTRTWHIISREESWLSAFARVVKIIKLRALN